MSKSPTPRDSDYWQSIYEEGDIGWDKGVPAPPIVRMIEDHPWPPNSRALVPGCGLGHEALFLAKQGYRVTAVDFALDAISSLKSRIGDLPITALQQDIFLLKEDRVASFDVVLEHTCFCAIPIEMRPSYAKVMSAVLVDSGRLVGLFYETDAVDGPPFKTTPADIEAHFRKYFEITLMEQPHDSFPARQGKEWLVEMRKR